MSAMTFLDKVTDEFMQKFDVDRVSAEEYVGLWLYDKHEEFWCTIGMDRKEMESFLESRIPNKAELLSFLDEGGVQ